MPEGKVPKYAKVPLDELFIDERYQREIIPAHLARIDKEFEEAQLGVLEVSRREDGTVAVFDGQHRYLVLKGKEWSWAPCLVHVGLTPQEEAELFRKLQDNRRKLTPIDKFKSRLFGEDPVAEGMAAAARKAKLEIGVGPKSLQAVVVVERVYRRGNLEETLDLLSLWRGDAKWLDGSLIDGLSRFLDLYAEADRQRCRTMWAEASPTVIIRRSAEFQAASHSSKAYGVLEVLRDLYKSRQHPLPKVAEAQAQRKAVQTAQGRRYRRVSLEEARDAARKLIEASSDGRTTTHELQKELGSSRAALVKRGGLIDQLLDQGLFKRVRDGGQGPYYLVAVPPGKEQSKLITQRRSHHDETARRNGGGPVPYTGRPEQRTGGQNRRQREKAARGRKIVQK